MDKNYVLEQAQQLARADLLNSLLERVKEHYERKINPLGLVDSFTAKIRNYNCSFDVNSSATALNTFYEMVAAIYRLKFGNNQLEFLWDGADHFQYYQKAWKEIFHQWTENFCRHDLFIQAVLDLTVFLPPDRPTQMIENRMNHFIQKYFEVRLMKGEIRLAANS